MRKRIVCIGECMVEISPAAQPGQFKLGFAGDTFNTAWYARRQLPADWSVSYFTVIGKDRLSCEFMQFATKAGLDTRHVSRRSECTLGLYMVHLTEGERSFSYWRAQSAARKLADNVNALQEALLGDVIYFSGITVAILSDIGRQNLFEELLNARSPERVIAFDPNLRPALWSNVLEMTKTITQFARVADIVLPSFEDECQYFGDAAPRDTITRYSKNGATQIVVKNGHREIYAVDQNGTEFRHLPDIVECPVDTTAAGDSFNAAYLTSVLSGESMPQSIKTASQISAQVVQGSGALVDYES